MTARLPTRSRRDAGITLMEILVAVSIIALVAVSVTLSFQTGSDPLKREADRLAVRLHQASQEAIVTGQPVGMRIDSRGSTYAFMTYVDGRWWPVRDHPTLAPHTMDEAFRVTLTSGVVLETDAPTEVLPLFWFDPAGVTEPFELSVSTNMDRIDIAWLAAGRLEIREDR